MEWMEQAVCRTVDPELFTGEDSPVQRHIAMNKAVAICNTCPVIYQCRSYAMRLAEQGPIHGVWGGLRPREINLMVRGVNR
jgi:WhiB family redox-sensing transcriptional regulator